MIEVIVAVILSIIINVIITWAICIRLFEETLDYLEKYMKKIALLEVIIDSLLIGKDKQQLHDLFEKQLKNIEKGAE